MKTEQTSTGITYTNFGSNNYSHGMEGVIFSPKDVTPEEIHTMEQFYLHPTETPNSQEIFALKGTPEQYLQFKESYKRQYVAKRIIEEFGIGWDDETKPARDKRQEELEAEFKSWFRPTPVQA